MKQKNQRLLATAVNFRCLLLSHAAYHFLACQSTAGGNFSPPASIHACTQICLDAFFVAYFVAFRHIMYAFCLCVWERKLECSCASGGLYSLDVCFLRDFEIA